jgi:hypothetical protein
VSSRRYWIVVCIAAMALGLAACGRDSKSEDANANNNGGYVAAGPITYQLQVSRQLNPYATEDKQYLTGLPAGTTQPKPDEMWYAVFLQAKNQTDAAAKSTDTFDIVDTQGNKYYPLQLNASENPYAWQPTTLEPSAKQPGADTTASFGPTQGQLLLFKLPTQVYSNRPLTLQIHAQGQSTPSTISLDL